MRYNSAYGSSAATRFIVEHSKAGVIVHTMSDAACRRIHAAFIAHWPKTLEQLRSNAARAMLRKAYKEIANTKANTKASNAKTQSERGAQ
jgi:2C-methyl-D-erythritol 2,4-cyclodiphosphate synthase